VGADRCSASVAAASVVAKVMRDRLMRRMDERHPGYGFANHVGYGTRAHREAIRLNGTCALHRLSFASLGATQLELSLDD